MRGFGVVAQPIFVHRKNREEVAKLSKAAGKLSEAADALKKAQPAMQSQHPVGARRMASRCAEARPVKTGR